MQFTDSVLGQIFLFACVLAALSIAGIFLILFGPLPGTRSVAMSPRFAVAAPVPAMPVYAAQVAPAESMFAPQPVFTAPEPIAPVAAIEAPPARRPKGEKVQPLPRKRSAKGTASPFAPVVRSAQRQVREEDAVTNPVPVFEPEDISEEMTRVDDPFRS